MVTHAFIDSIWKAETRRSLSLRTPGLHNKVPGQPGLHRETLSQNAQTRDYLGTQMKLMAATAARMKCTQ